MTESDPPERPSRRWLVITASAALVGGALALALWVAAPATPVRVVYRVDGTAARATVTYSTFRDGETRQEELTSFPWHKELVVADEPEHGVLTVTIGPDGGDMACEVTVGEEERRSATATGSHTSALCGF